MEERHGRNCGRHEGTRRIGPSRRIPSSTTEHRLPTTPPPDRAAGPATASPCILLHGLPLNTPAKVHFGLLPPVHTACNGHEDKGKAPDDLPKKTRKNSFQRAVDVNKETLENTKKNSGYSTIDIVKELVRVDGPRPPSPTFSSGKGARTRAKSKHHDLGASGASRLKFADSPTDAPSDQNVLSNEPPFYDTFFPLKSILKAKDRPAERSTDDRKTQPVEKVTVKKIVYADDDPDVFVGMVDVLPAEPKPAHCKPAKPQRLKGPARRIVR